MIQRFQTREPTLKHGFDTLEQQHEEEHHRRTTLVCVNTILIIFILFLLFRACFGFAYIVGLSMEPMYHNNELVLFWKTRHADYGDVVIAYCDPLEKYVIKRVVGKSGDTIEIINGVTYRNKQPLTEYNIIVDPEDNMIPTVVPETEYFLMGDNRPVSNDSRSDNIATFQPEDMYGVVILEFDF